MAPATTKDRHMSTSEDQLRAWMIAGLSGDAAAHACLLRALLPLLRGFYRRRLPGCEQDTEDLVQEVLIAVHSRRATWQPERPFTAWLYAIARYKLADHFRSRRQHVPIEDLADILAIEGFAEAADASADVRRLLAQLPPKQAEAIRTTHLEGLSVAEAAERAGIGQSDVKVSVHRGLKALAARVKDALT